MEDYSMITNHKFHPKVARLILLALIGAGNVSSMENPYDTSLHTTYINEAEANNGLTQVRKYLLDKTNAITAIANTLKLHTDAFKEINGVTGQLQPTTMLTSDCYVSFENDNEQPKGKIKRELLKINADGKKLIKNIDIPISMGNNGFKIIPPKNAKATKQSQHSFNVPIQNLIPNIGKGYFFILKSNGKTPLNTQDKEKCFELLKTIKEINTCVSSKEFYDSKDPLENINYLSDTSDIPEVQNLVLFTQRVYNQAKSLRLLHAYKNELSKDSQLLSLTQRLPKDIITKEKTLSFLQKITLQLAKVYTILHEARQKDLSISPTIFADLQNSLSQWVTIFNNDNTFDQTAQKIITLCDNWLPTIKWHNRIEDKNKDNSTDNFVPDNQYINGHYSNEQIRYNPNHWLNQCSKQINGIIWQLFNNPEYIPVIHNLYINSPLMIDNITLKHGIKTAWNLDSFRYNLKGKIYILLPTNNGGWQRAWNKNTQQPFYIERTFNCAITHNSCNDVYEVYHRGADKNLPDNHDNILEQCYAHNEHCTNDNWFADNDQFSLAQRLNPIVSQQSSTDTQNGYNINKYHAEQHNTYGTYTDIFDNFICTVNDSLLTISMPQLGRTWAMEIVLEKPTKHNLI